jgi:hypothetical protein
MGSRDIALLFPLLQRLMGWVVNAKPWTLYPWVRDPVSIVQEAGWDPGPAWAGAEK